MAAAAAVAQDAAAAPALGGSRVGAQLWWCMAAPGLRAGGRGVSSDSPGVDGEVPSRWWPRESVLGFSNQFEGEGLGGLGRGSCCRRGSPELEKWARAKRGGYCGG